MSEPLDLRPLTVADGDRLLRFYRARPPWIVHWFDPFPEPDSEKISRHLEQSAADSAISLGLLDAAGELVGHGFILELASDRPVFGIGLAEAAIGHGHGRALMAAVLAEADRRRLPKVTLTVFKDNLRARRLYEGFDFVMVGEHSCRSAGDSLAMERSLGGAAAREGQRSALLRLLAGRRPRRPVWTADITYWIAGQQARGTADPAWQSEAGYLELHRQLGIMPYYDYTKFWAGTASYDDAVGETWQRRGGEAVHRLTTPLGELREEYTELPESACTGCTRHFVQTPDDLDRLLCLLEHRTLAPSHLDDYQARLAAWAAADGLPALGLPRSPLSSFCYEWAGIENAIYLLTDCEAKVRRILELIEEQQAPVLEAVCRLAPPLVHFPDNLDSENLTGLYDEFLAPTHRRRLARLHGAGIRAAVHLDGAVRGLLPKLLAVGFDAIEALTPQPAGDLAVEEMAALAASHPQAILWGGVPGVMFAPPYTWSDLRRHVERVLEVWGGRPFVLGVADQVPPDGNLQFCHHIHDLLGGA